MKKLLFISTLSLLLGLPSLLVAQSSALTLIWEADSYTPPFYLGKALPGPEAEVKVTVMPPDSAAWEYIWTKDGEKLAGVGGNTFTFSTDAGRSQHLISVTALNRATKTMLQGSVSIPVEPPRLIIYEKEPLSGLLYNKVIEGEYNLIKPELSLSVTPYYFSRSDFGMGRLEYKWWLNGEQVITDAATLDTMLFTAPAQGSSTGNKVQITVRNLKRLLQSGEKRIIMNAQNQSLGF